MKYKTGLIAGSFDIVHPGYIRMFKESKKICQFLTVALQDNPTIDRPQKCKPVQTWEQRKEILEAIVYVDRIVRYNTEEELYHLLKDLDYQVRILGSDYVDKDYTGKDLKKDVYYCHRNHEYSTTRLKKLISESLSL